MRVEGGRRHGEGGRGWRSEMTEGDLPAEGGGSRTVGSPSEHTEVGWGWAVLT